MSVSAGCRLSRHGSHRRWLTLLLFRTPLAVMSASRFLTRHRALAQSVSQASRHSSTQRLGLSPTNSRPQSPTSRYRCVTSALLARCTQWRRARQSITLAVFADALRRTVSSAAPPSSLVRPRRSRSRRTLPRRSIAARLVDRVDSRNFTSQESPVPNPARDSSISFVSSGMPFRNTNGIVTIPREISDRTELSLWFRGHPPTRGYFNNPSDGKLFPRGRRRRRQLCCLGQFRRSRLSADGEFMLPPPSGQSLSKAAATPILYEVEELAGRPQ